MKWILCSLLFIFFSCQKEPNDIGPDYYKVIGSWQSINSDEIIKVEFESNGKINITRSIERGAVFKIKSFSFRANYQGLKYYKLENKEYPYLEVGLSENSDSITMTSFGVIDNLEATSDLLYLKKI